MKGIVDTLEFLLDVCVEFIDEFFAPLVLFVATIIVFIVLLPIALPIYFYRKVRRKKNVN